MSIKSRCLSLDEEEEEGRVPVDPKTTLSYNFVVGSEKRTEGPLSFQTRKNVDHKGHKHPDHSLFNIVQPERAIKKNASYA